MIILKKKYKNYKKNNKKTKITILICLLIISFAICNQFFFKSTFFLNIGSTITKVFIPKNIDYKNTTSLQEENLKKEISELENLLSLKNTMSGYEMIYTTVINRNIDYWFYTLTVDKGKKDGVKIDMVVINQDGLVGKVIEVHNNSSVIKLISSNDPQNKVSVDIISGDNIYKGIITGYDLIKKKVLVTSIHSISDIHEKDTIITNGIGNLFPYGITVGTVENITSDDLGVSKVLEVDSKVDFENLRYLAILKRGNDS